MQMKKSITLIVLFFIIVLIIPSFTYADDPNISSITSQMASTNEFDTNMNTSNGMGKVINIVIGLIQVAGTGISIIVLTIQGIKYIVASPNDKADVKKGAIPIVIGCVLLFAATNIVGIIADAAGETLGSGGTNP